MKSATLKPALVLAACLVALPLAAADGDLVSKAETKTVHARIEDLDRAARTVTLKDAEGNPLTLTAGTDVKRFDELKVGDDVTLKYIEALVIAVHDRDESAAGGAREQTFHGSGPKPAGARARRKTEVVTIDAVDPEAQVVTFTTGDGRSQSLHTDDRKMLDNLHPGDRVDITWTTATLVSVD